MMEAIRVSETTVFTRATQHHIPEDAILHTHTRTQTTCEVVPQLQCPVARRSGALLGSVGRSQEQAFGQT
jgi:hypothetical protein